MSLFKISKGNQENLPKLKREGYAYFTVDENDFYIDIQNSDTDANGNFLYDNDGNPIGGVIHLFANPHFILKSPLVNILYTNNIAR